MNSITLLFKSSLGKKVVMAGTGAALLCFVVGHLLGNLQIFLPPEAINRYGHFLQSTPELLWTARLGLLVMVSLHIWSALRLWQENRAARPVPYALDPAVNTSGLAARTMIVSGLTIAAFAVYHLLHYTVCLDSVTGTQIRFGSLTEPSTGHHDVYAMMVAGFSVWYVSVFYIVAIGLLCFHLSHGVAAMFQSLGLMNRPYRAWIAWLARGLAIVLFCGYASIPAAVMLGHGRDYLQRVIAHSQTATTIPQGRE